jgi:hypothetical protein
VLTNWISFLALATAPRAHRNAAVTSHWTGRLSVVIFPGLFGLLPAASVESWILLRLQSIDLDHPSPEGSRIPGRGVSLKHETGGIAPAVTSVIVQRSGEAFGRCGEDPRRRLRVKNSNVWQVGILWGGTWLRSIADGNGLLAVWSTET